MSVGTTGGRRELCAVGGLPGVLLRTEGAALTALVVTLYGRFGESWLLFILLLLAPDLGMLGYLAGSRAGAFTYDLFHTYAPPAALGIAGVLAESPVTYSIALIWFAHIGMDRLLGYGLKYSTGFRDTHLGSIGRGPSERP